MPCYFQIYMVFIFNPIFTWTVFPSSDIWKHHCSFILSGERERRACLWEHPPPDSPELCVLQRAGAHGQQREICVCFFINRLCHRFLSWLIMTAFLTTTDSLCVVGVPVVWNTCVHSSGGAAVLPRHSLCRHIWGADISHKIFCFPHVQCSHSSPFFH